MMQLKACCAACERGVLQGMEPAEPGLRVRPKLVVGAPGDAYEREADRMADRVVRMQDSELISDRTSPGTLSRGADVSRARAAPRNGSLPIGTGASGLAVTGDHAERAAEAISTRGRLLTRIERDYFEPRFGHDFSQVRIHDDRGAAEAATKIRARAYAVGQHIALPKRNYSPETDTGRRLLAHELVHTLQQLPNPMVLRNDEGNLPEPTVVSRPGQLSEMGGIQLIGPAITLESDFTSSVTGFMNISYELREGTGTSGAIVERGRFLSTGMIPRNLPRGQVFRLSMRGPVQVNENNLIFNDAFNGLSVSVDWLIRPPMTGGSNQDEAVELLGAPTVNPLSHPFGLDRSDWNIVVNDISRSRLNSSQVGLHIRFTSDSSVSSGYGGSIDLGESAQASASSSRSVTVSSLGSLVAFFRFTHV